MANENSKEKMKAIISKKRGIPDGLELVEVDKPTPKDNEVLLKVMAGSVTRGDVIVQNLPAIFGLPMRLLGFKKKEITGHELAGVVEEIGKKATKFQVGDKVFGTTTGLSVGGNTEYIAMPEEWKKGVLEKMPSKITFNEAAVLPIGGMTALYLLRKADIQNGQKVLIYGASGSVGSFAVQLAKYFGADVTGVCSTDNVDMVKSLGAEKVIDYKKEDFSESGEMYDLIFDAVGKSSSAARKKVLKKGGRSVTIRSFTKEQGDALLFLKKLAEEGEIKPFIDKVYSLNQVPEAYEYVNSGHKRGNVVVEISK